MRGPTHRIPGLVLTDHAFALPLDHARPAGKTIEVFARELVLPGREDRDLPWLVFLQGGPGFAGPRPFAATGWIGRALQEYRVLLLDSRGTGRSTAATWQSLGALGSPGKQAEYLSHFRADSIVKDCELMRRELSLGRPWTVLGQSYGGFCAVHYLSAAPEGLSEVIITGGLPPLAAACDDIYRRTYPRVAARNRAYYARYPGDVARVAAIIERLAQGDVKLPSGDVLTPRRFRLLGLLLGFSDGFETIHYLIEDAFVPDSNQMAYSFLKTFEGALHYETNPIFSVLHEACYTQGVASRWSAQRILAEFPEFEVPTAGPVLFTGEMIYPWMFDDIATLRPLRDAAHILADKGDWPALYDVATLGNNTVPAVAAVYSEDMYVERGFSEATASSIGGLRVWLTNEYEHNGLRADGDRVLGGLLDRLHGRS